VSLQNDSVAVDPKLPANWRSLGFRLQWRGRHLKISIDQTEQRLEATLEAGEPMTLVVSNEPQELCRGQALRVDIGK